ncbi:MAG: adenosylcobinamide amidohydrolase [Halanaeroarchaeum sp.]
MPEEAIRDGVFRLRAPGSRWLATGWDGGYHSTDAAYSVAVPGDWRHVTLAEYVTARREAAGFGAPGPALLTAVPMDHLVGARSGPVTAYVTAGLSNPATLPRADTARDTGDGSVRPPAGTVNVLLFAERALSDGALATLLAVVTEAKTATLLDRTGFTGTTTDAVIVGSDPGEEPARFAGSSTAVGAAARVCVREGVTAALASYYRDRSIPDSVDEAEHGVVTSGRAEPFDPGR